TELKEQAGGLPVFFSYGIPVQPDNHNGFSDPLSLEFQAFYIKNSWSIAKELGLAGNMINSYNDYLLNHPLLITDNEDQYLCATGLVSRDRQQRLSFKTLQSLFNMEKEPLLNAGSHSEKTPVSYIIFGLLLLVIIVVLSNSSRRFREYLFRSVLRPYNFYADIRDQRIMSFLQTLLLGIVIAFSLGIFLSSIFYYYRTDIISQYIYIQLLTVNELRELFFNLVWMPELSLLVIALLYLAMLFIVSGIIKVFAFFLRARIFFADAFTLSVWSAVPMLLVLPIGIVLIRVLVLSDALISIVLLLFGIICLWIFARLLKSNAVVFDKPPMKVYLTGVGVLAVVLGVITGIYQYQYSIFAYAEYFFKIMV
ncbi:MAG: Yip1 family protein, partial [Candidatus Kapaibacterium sp.]